VNAMTSEHPNNPSPGPRWLAPVVMTLGAWLFAWLVVAGLLTYFGKQLASLPLGVRALVMSGLLVALMVNLVMPVLSAAIARLKRRPRRARLPGGRLGTTPAHKSRA
jgi:antibiotic biosynthesis monooxygenase (ABM) superfamily enzyme